MTAYLGQQNQAEQSMVTIGGLMQKVSFSSFIPEDATAAPRRSINFRRRRRQLPNPVSLLSFFVVEPLSKPPVGFAYVSVGLVHVGSLG